MNKRHVFTDYTKMIEWARAQDNTCMCEYASDLGRFYKVFSIENIADFIEEDWFLLTPIIIEEIIQPDGIIWYSLNSNNKDFEKCFIKKYPGEFNKNV